MVMAMPRSFHQWSGRVRATRVAGKAARALSRDWPDLNARETELRRRFRWLSRVCGGLVAVIGALAAIGWMFHIQLLEHGRASWISTDPNTALALLLGGLAAGLAGQPSLGRGRKTWIRVLSLPLCLLGAFSLAGFFTGWHGPEHWLIPPSPELPAVLHPRGVSPTIGSGCVLAGLALLLAVNLRRIIWSQVCAAITGLVGLLLLVEYAYGADIVYEYSSSTYCSFATAAGLILLAFAVFFAYPARGLMVILSSDTFAGRIARHLLPVSCGLPFVLGWLRLWGQRNMLYGPEMGTAMTATLGMFILSTLIWAAAAGLFFSEHAARQRNERLTLLAQTAQELLAAHDSDAILPNLFPKLASVLGLDIYLNYMVDSTGRALELRSFAGISEQAARPMRQLAFGQACCGLVAQQRQPLIGAKIQETTDATFGLARAVGAQALVCTPLLADGRLLGTLSFASRTVKEFELEEVEFLTTLSQYVALAMDRLKSAAALLESEERLRLAMDAAHLGSWIWDTREQRFYLSPEQALLFGLPPGTPVVPLAEIQQLIDAEDRPGLCQAIIEAVARRTVFAREYRIRGPEGEPRWIAMRGQAQYDAAGQAGRLTGVSMDITERVRGEQELRALTQVLEERVKERTAELEQTLRSTEELLYTIAHDLRAPNRTMQGFAQLLLEHYEARLDDTARSYLERIAQAAVRNDWLIGDLLELGRLGHERMDCGPVALGGAVHQAVYTLSFEIQNRQAAIHLAEPWPKVWGNARALHQILANLLSNALKYVAPGQTPAVTVWAETRNGSVRVFVKDNGIGLPPEARERVFLPFIRLATELQVPGTGMGLALVRKAAERMGGRVGVESEPGRGSCFWVELKRAED